MNKVCVGPSTGLNILKNTELSCSGQHSNPTRTEILLATFSTSVYSIFSVTCRRKSLKQTEGKTKFVLLTL